MTERPIRLLVDSGSDRFVGRLREIADPAEIEIVSYLGQGEAGLAAHIGTADAVYIYQHPLLAEHFAAAPNLCFVQKHGLNCKNIDLAAAQRAGVAVATLPLFRNATVAEHAMALMLACTRKIVAGHKAVEAATYRNMGLEPIRTAQREYRANWAKIEGVGELMGTTLGIVGLGDIGMEIAVRARAFGMQIAYHQRERHRPDIEARYGARYLDLADLLAEIDTLVLVLPHTPQTDGLIGAAELALMKPTATLINVARGGVVDEDALIAALQTGRIAMAGLDVYRSEPLPEASPLRHMPNVVLTPHTGGGSYRSRVLDHPAGLANILRFFSGEAAHNLVVAT